MFDHLTDGLFSNISDSISSIIFSKKNKTIRKARKTLSSNPLN